MPCNLSAYSFANNKGLSFYAIASGALTTGELDPQTGQTRDGGYSPPPISVVYTPREIDGEDSLIFDNYLSEASTVSVNLSTTSTCVNVATGYDLFNFGYQLLIEEKGQVLDRIDTFNYNNTFNIVCSASLISNWTILSSTAIYNKVTTSLSGTGVDLLPVGRYRRTTSPNDILTVKYYLPIEQSAPIFWTGELLNLYKTKKIVWDMFSTRLGGEDLKNTFIPFNLNETTYVVDQPRDLSLYTINDYISTRVDFSLSAVQLGNTLQGNTGAFGQREEFGRSVDTNDDGTRIVVGAPLYDSDFTDGFNRMVGAVRVYQLVDSIWVQMGQDLVGSADSDYFGSAVSMDGSGNRIAVGYWSGNDNGANSGVTKIYEWNGSSWVQLGAAIVGQSVDAYSGWAIQLNSIGNRIVIDDRFSNNGGYASGQVRVFEWSGTAWMQMGGSILPTYVETGPVYEGILRVSINAAGDIIAFSKPNADVPPNNDLGAVYVYGWNGVSWNQIGETIYGDVDYSYYYLLGGYALSLNSAGDILAVTAIMGGGYNKVLIYKYDDASWNIIGDLTGPTDTFTYGYSISLNSAGDRIAIGDRSRFSYSRGAVEVYEYNGTYWEKIIVDIEGPFNGTNYVFFGESVALNKNGDRLTVGAHYISGGQVRNYQLPQYPLVGLSSYSAYKSSMLWSDGVVTENPFIYPFYLPDGTYGSNAGTINFRKFTTPGEYTILSNTFYYKNSLNKEIILTEPYNITFVVS